MKRLSFLLVFSLNLVLLHAQQYQISTDLSNISKDQVSVSVIVPPVNAETAEFVFPKVIPGSYSVKDFGRFIDKFKAFDAEGKKLKVKKSGENVFVIRNATRLHKITYLVNDTWDAGKDNFIFQPGGTNIEAGKNIVINHQGFWGYLEGMKNIPYVIEITRPSQFYTATALDVERSAIKDVLSAPGYVQLVDNPVLIARPDTISFKVGDTRIHTAVYAERGVVTAQKIQQILRPLGEGLHRYFDGLPVSDYYFLFYFPDPANQSITANGGYGALEHNYSSFYFLPELNDTARLRDMVSSVAAHEFFHILTPLNLHSEEIENFDFRNPEMSRHLWLYEGVTEYLSWLMQWKEGLISEDDFLDEMSDKIKTASSFRDVSFTEMSRNILSPEYKEDYSNVYYKGALLALFLDIKLRESSKGERGLRDVMLELANRYGPSKPFRDSSLIPEIVALTSPEIDAYFKKHIEGSEPLPLNELFNIVGYRYFETREDSLTTFGRIAFSMDEVSEELKVVNTPSDRNVFGLENDDVILKINDNTITAENYNQVLQPLMPGNTEKVAIIMRRGTDTYKIEAEPVTVPVEFHHIIERDPAAESGAIRLRESILN